VVLDEEEAKAQELSFFAHLFLPDLVDEHIERLGLQPAHTRHNNILAPSIDTPQPPLPRGVDTPDTKGIF
jgi:hypothetical protein